MAYLARYESRVAISNDRLMGIENDEVLFWYHDKRDGGQKKIAQLPALEFIDSIFAARAAARKAACAELRVSVSRVNAADEPADASRALRLGSKTGGGRGHEKGDEPTKEKDERPERICPRCEVGVMVSVQEFPRPTVHQIMQMTLDELRQPMLPFT